MKIVETSLSSINNVKDSKIIGCGTGRCGTKSLAKLLDSQDGWTCTHEKLPRLPWKIDRILARDRVRYFNNHEKFGDVAFYYLPYIEMMFEEIDDLKVICLERDEEEVVNSYIVKMSNTDPPRNHWTDHDGKVWTKDPIWDRAYPSYDLGDPLPSELPRPPEEYKEEVIRLYWNEYHETAEWLSKHYIDFEVFDTEFLNSKQGQENIFEFLEIEDPNLNVGIRENKLVTQ